MLDPSNYGPNLENPSGVSSVLPTLAWPTFQLYYLTFCFTIKTKFCIPTKLQLCAIVLTLKPEPFESNRSSRPHLVDYSFSYCFSFCPTQLIPRSRSLNVKAAGRDAQLTAPKKFNWDNGAPCFAQEMAPRHWSDNLMRLRRCSVEQ